MIPNNAIFNENTAICVSGTCIGCTSIITHIKKNDYSEFHFYFQGKGEVVLVFWRDNIEEPIFIFLRSKDNI